MAGKYLDYDGLAYLWSKLAAAAGDPTYYPLDTTTTSGRDHDLWQAIQELGWDATSEGVIVSD